MALGGARTLAVIGGGVIGLSVARRAALDGWTVRLHCTTERGASWVVGGMLAPHSEGWPGEERSPESVWNRWLVALGIPRRIAARGRHRPRIPRGGNCGPRRRGRSAYRRRLAFGPRGSRSNRPTAARDVEPLLAQGIRHGFGPPPNSPWTTAPWSTAWPPIVSGWPCGGPGRSRTSMRCETSTRS